MFRVLEVKAESYYAWLRRGKSSRTKEDEMLSLKIKSIHESSRSTYGAPRIQAELKANGYHISRGRIRRLMRKQGLLTRYKTSFRRMSKSESAKIQPEPNLLNQNFEAKHPNEKWSTDITYIKTKNGWLYLSVVMDLYSRAIVGWAMDNHLQTALPSRALHMAFLNRKSREGLMHHSDQGAQYTSTEYRLLLKTNDLVSSMSRRGNCYDNAVIESFFSTLKTELDLYDGKNTREETENRIFSWIEGWYNPRRRHSTLGYLSPQEYESQHEKSSLF